MSPSPTLFSLRHPQALPRAGSRPGFTLIELLTVIAIIAILAAILIPVVGHVRAKAKAAVCGSNLRAIGVALRCYETDHKTLPDGYRTIEGGTWDKALYQGGYLGSAKARQNAFACPSDEIVRNQGLDLPNRSYACNSQVMYVVDSSPAHCLQGQLQRTQRPLSGLVLIFERPTGGNYFSKQWGVGFPGPYASETISPNSSHKTGANWLMADGSVRFLDFMAVGGSSVISASSGAFQAKYFAVK